MENNNVHFSSATNEWYTPPEIFDELNKEFNFTLDPCATPKSAKCSKYYTKEDDGLAQSWEGHTVFVNPPYGREIGKWVEKAFMESLLGGLLWSCSSLQEQTRLTSTITFITKRKRSAFYAVELSS